MTIKVLFCSETPISTTGYGRITKELLGRIAAISQRDCIIELHCHAWYHPPGITISPPPKYKIHPAARDEKEYRALGEIKDRVPEKTGKNSFNDIVKTVAPDVVISLGDCWMMSYIADSPHRDTFKWMAYIPIDGIPLTPHIKKVARNADMVISMSRFAEMVIGEEIPSVRSRTIYPGVDTRKFRQIADKTALKNASSAGGSMAKKFIVQVVARNQPRKMIGRMIMGYNEFAKDKSDTALYLHMAENDAGWPLRRLINSINPNMDVILSEHLTPSKAWDTDKYVMMLNLADVGLLASGGEGFGIPVLEWMACGVPVCAINYAATAELVRGRGEAIEVSDFMIERGSCVRRSLASIDSIAEKLSMLYINADLREKHSQAGREFAMANDWNNIAEQWLEAIYDLHEAGRPEGFLLRDPVRPVRLEVV